MTRDTPNKGRQFYGCSKPVSASDRCNFFLWADDPPPSSGPPQTMQFNDRANIQNNNGRTNNAYRARFGNSKY